MLVHGTARANYSTILLTFCGDQVHGDRMSLLLIVILSHHFIKHTLLFCHVCDAPRCEREVGHGSVTHTSIGL